MNTLVTHALNMIVSANLDTLGQSLQHSQKIQMIDTIYGYCIKGVPALFGMAAIGLLASMAQQIAHEGKQLVDKVHGGIRSIATTAASITPAKDEDDLINKTSKTMGPPDGPEFRKNTAKPADIFRNKTGPKGMPGAPMVEDKVARGIGFADADPVYAAGGSSKMTQVSLDAAHFSQQQAHGVLDSLQNGGTVFMSGKGHPHLYKKIEQPGIGERYIDITDPININPVPAEEGRYDNCTINTRADIMQRAYGNHSGDGPLSFAATDLDPTRSSGPDFTAALNEVPPGGRVNVSSAGIKTAGYVRSDGGGPEPKFKQINSQQNALDGATFHDVDPYKEYTAQDLAETYVPGYAEELQRDWQQTRRSLYDDQGNLKHLQTPTTVDIDPMRSSGPEFTAALNEVPPGGRVNVSSGRSAPSSFMRSDGGGPEPKFQQIFSQESHFSASHDIDPLKEYSAQDLAKVYVPGYAENSQRDSQKTSGEDL